MASGRVIRPIDEPTAEEAARLVTAIMGAGTVGRLDTVHEALRDAYMRGRADVRAEAQELCVRAAQRFADEAQRMAMTHAQEFVQSVADQATSEEEITRLPWMLRAVGE
jgi:hypothetical protein